MVERPRTKKRWATVPIVAVLSITGSGCSLVLTRGPEPYAQWSDHCTTSNATAIADTVLAVASFAALVGGTIASVDATKCQVWGCGWNEELTGLGLIAGGLIGTAIFTPSAVVGYNRSAACRDWLATPSPILAPASMQRTGQ